jgi:NadR type nicotinamide-nucleotide adenylyltransferase
MKRIVLIGAESTGKSTLAQALSGYYGEPWTAEYVRYYVDRIGRELNESDLEPIAIGQLAQEDCYLKMACRLILHDTNILSSIIYANYYFGRSIEWVNDDFLNRSYDLYLLCLPDIPWVPDPGQRESPQARAKLHQHFKDGLDQLQLPYITLSGSQTARFGEAIQAIDALPA